MPGQGSKASTRLCLAHQRSLTFFSKLSIGDSYLQTVFLFYYIQFCLEVLIVNIALGLQNDPHLKEEKA